MSFEINNKLPSIDFSDVETPEYEPTVRLPEGVYNLKCDSVDIGNDMQFKFIFEIVDGKYKGFRLFYTTNIFKYDTAKKYFAHMMTVMGFTVEELNEMGKDFAKSIYALIDLNVVGKIVKVTKGDREFINIKFFNKPRPEYNNGTNLYKRFLDKQQVIDKALDEDDFFKED